MNIRYPIYEGVYRILTDYLPYGTGRFLDGGRWISWEANPE